VQSTSIVYDGAPCLLASLRDITDGKRIAEALRESESRYRTLFERAPDGIVIADPKGYYIDTNAAMCRMIGYTRDELIGLHSSDIVAPAEIQHIDAALGAIKAAADYHREWQFRRKDGSIFTAEVIATQMPDGNPMAMIRDITERMQKEEELHRAGALQRAMQEASRLKTEFLANMSHELRTPLNAIIGFAELMHRGKVGPVSAEHKEYLGDILTSSTHLLQLINDVLDLAKVESGKMEFRLESVDLTKLAREVGDIVRGLAASGRVQLETCVDPAVATVVVDPARVKQILYNYVSNAIKFTPPGGRITIRIGPEGPALFRIDVEDTGVGIAADDLGKLFVEFQQLDASAAKKYQGTGLGLALTKKLAEAHGGRVTVRSTPGTGSTFSVILPRLMTVTASDEVAGPFMGLPAGNRTILVVDDDPAALKLVSLALREVGYRPVCCADPEEALRMAEADPPGIVIVDLLMPGVDGFEFVSRFRAMPAGRDVPVIVWTVKDLDAAERRRLQPSITGLVSKNAGGSHALVEELRRLLLAECAMPKGGHPQGIDNDRP
jgi:PAS domain S-box-containing protein